MKKVYSSPKLTANEYARFENVYTDGCTKQYSPNDGWTANCAYDPNIEPEYDPSGTNRHVNTTGS